MTNAERQRRWIAKLKAEARAAREGVSNAALREELAKVKAELAVEKEQTRVTNAELIAVKVELVAERKRRREAKPEEKPEPTDEQRDRQIKSLRTRVRNLTQDLAQYWQWHHEEMKRIGGLPFDTAAAIAKALQPSSSEAEKLDALQRYNLFRSQQRKAGRR